MSSFNLPTIQVKTVRPFAHCPYDTAAVAAITSMTSTVNFQSNSFHGPSPQPMQPLGSGTGRGSVGKPAQMFVTQTMVQGSVGRMRALALTANGSSFLQAGLRSSSVSFTMIMAELRPHFPHLLLDDHGCYVVRALLDMLPDRDIATIFAQLSGDEGFMVHLFTQSLHTRRIVQFVLERLEPIECGCMVTVALRHFNRIALTQQGCITLQRLMDRCEMCDRDALLDLVLLNSLEFAFHCHGNFLVQYMVQACDRSSLESVMIPTFQTYITRMSCDKFASNVVEKLITRLLPEGRTRVLVELFGAAPEDLTFVAQNSFGNYIIQTAIENSPPDLLVYVHHRLSPLLSHTPFATKMLSRLTRRMQSALASQGSSFSSSVSSENVTPTDSDSE